MMKDNKSRQTVLIGGREKREIKIVNYDPSWSRKFDEHAKKIKNSLGDRVLLLELIGSTSVPELAAKPIIDMDVVVADSADEAAYLPALESAGYALRVREPDWHEHRMLRSPALDVHIHVKAGWSVPPNSPKNAVDSTRWAGSPSRESPIGVGCLHPSVTRLPPSAGVR